MSNQKRSNISDLFSLYYIYSLTVLFCYFLMYRRLRYPKLFRRLPYSCLLFNNIICYLYSPFLNIIFQGKPPKMPFLHTMKALFKLYTIVPAPAEYAQAKLFRLLSCSPAFKTTAPPDYPNHTPFLNQRPGAACHDLAQFHTIFHV